MTPILLFWYVLLVLVAIAVGLLALGIAAGILYIGRAAVVGISMPPSPEELGKAELERAMRERRRKDRVVRRRQVFARWFALIPKIQLTTPKSRAEARARKAIQ